VRRRSVTGPLMLLLIGALLLWRNLHPEWEIFDTISRFWPFVLIAWGCLRLIEIFVTRSRGYTTFTGGEVALIVIICIAGSMMWQARQHGFRIGTRGLDVFGEQYDYPVSARASGLGMTRITFENRRGNIKITGTDAAEVVITGRKVIRAWSRRDADQTGQNTPLEIVPQGDRLLVRTNQDHVPDSQRIDNDLEVSIPRGLIVEARGRTGDYEIADVARDVELFIDRADVRLARVGGNVRMEIGRSDTIRALDIKGKVDLTGRGSHLDFENIAGQVTVSGSFVGTQQFKALAKPLQFEGSRNTEVRVHAIPGRISMDLGELTGSGVVGPMRVVTKSRDIRLEAFTQSLEIEIERGDILLQPAMPMPSIDARSGSGRIDLVLPEKAAFDLQATAEKGEVTNDFGSQIRSDKEGRTSTMKGKVGDGPSVKLTANRGSVSIRKEGTLPAEAPESERRKQLKSLKNSEVKM
jgi:DUF4097 and DUF4098 domain-containing protein YvlB